MYITTNELSKYLELSNITYLNHKDDVINSTIYDSNKKQDALFISGGATKFVGLAAAAIRLYELGYKPNILGGISSGSIIILPLVMGKHEELLKYGLKATRKNIFEKPPTTEKGWISLNAIFRVIFGKYSFGVQNIKPMLREVITPYIWDKYRNEDYPELYIMAVNANTGSRKLWNLKYDDIDYEKYLKIVSASSRIPIMTQAQWIDDEPYFDGGLRNHIPSSKILDIRKDIKKFASIYSRPKNFEYIDHKWDKNIIKIIWRTIDILSLEISKRDQQFEKMVSKSNSIVCKQFFLEDILESKYDLNIDRLNELKKSSIEIIDNNIGNFIKL